jgi:hypothetical protein
VQTKIEKGAWKSPEQLAAEEAAAEVPGITVRELAEVWVATIPSVNHREMSASRVRRFINPTLGDLAVDDLTRERCEQWYASLCPTTPPNGHAPTPPSTRF